MNDPAQRYWRLYMEMFDLASKLRAPGANYTIVCPDERTADVCARMLERVYREHPWLQRESNTSAGSTVCRFVWGGEQVHGLSVEQIVID